MSKNNYLWKKSQKGQWLERDMGFNKQSWNRRQVVWAQGLVGV